MSSERAEVMWADATNRRKRARKLGTRVGMSEMGSFDAGSHLCICVASFLSCGSLPTCYGRSFWCLLSWMAKGEVDIIEPSATSAEVSYYFVLSMQSR